MRFSTLDDWLRWQEGLHPTAMDLGLERVRAVAARMDWPVPRPFPLIVVAGTNGKGSSVAYLEAIYHAAGCRTGTYTSPHLQRYNERIRIARREASDSALMSAFDRLDQARADITITYFEYGTLAAMDLFIREAVDVAIMEVGIGGRLDAVNIFDADCALLTAIDIDHRKWLGDTREAIAIEKAGILRRGRPAVCSDVQPPATVAQCANETGADLWLRGRDFDLADGSDAAGWRYSDAGGGSALMPEPGLSGRWQRGNAAGALAVVARLQPRLAVPLQACEQGVREPGLRGRLQVLSCAPEVLVDVAHNPQATGALARHLACQPVRGRTLAVVGMLSDKDISTSLAELVPHVAQWFTGSTDGPRGLGADELAALIGELPVERSQVRSCGSVPDALVAALAAAGACDRIVVFGSFHTVGEVLDSYDASASHDAAARAGGG